MAHYIVYCIIAYFLYRFVTRFVMPLVRVANTASRQVRKMQDHIRTMNDASQTRQHSAQHHPDTSRPGDYIDYEEVK